MPVDLTETEQEVVDLFRRFFRNESPLSRARSAAASDGFDSGLWEEFVALGGHTVSLREPNGGGGTDVDAMLVAAEAGRQLAPIPYVESVTALRLAERAEVAALLELGSREPVDVVTAVRGDRGRLVAVSTAGLVAPHVLAIEGPTAFLVDLRHRGVEREPLRNLGHLPLARIMFDPTAVLGAFPVSDGQQDIARCDRRILTAAMLLGAGQEAQRLVLDHVREREQFDRPIGSFQAVQHRLADRATDLESAWLLVTAAARVPTDADDRRYASAVALHAASAASERAAKESMQLFGGYGFSLEYDVHLYLRHVKSWRVLSADDRLEIDSTPALLRATSNGD